MIRLGICADIANIATVERCGYDYLEAGLARLAAMTDAEYERAVGQVEDAGIRVEACNGMLPPEVRVTGPEVSAQKIHDYLDHAFARARRLGCEIVVFGSAGARNVPEGFEIDVAWRQIGNFLRIAQGHAQDYGITIAIEPLRRGESNIINLVSEAVLIASIMQLKNVKALGDTYHMAMCSEPLSALTQAGHMLAHVHTANALGRILPAEGDGEDYAG
ncbi:MAG: sugar phosphate isomerase/epimerase family protein, partial [Christensenellales bacterium]